MVAAVRVVKGMQGVVGVHPKTVGGDKNSARGAQGDVASAVADNAGAHGRRGVVAGAGSHHHVLAQAQERGHVLFQGAHTFIAFKQLWQLLFRDAAFPKHFPAPAAVFDVQQQHARRVAEIGAVYAGQDIVDVVLGQHDLADPVEILLFVFPHPQYFGGGKAGEGDVGRPFGQLPAAHLLVEVVHFLLGAPVVPEDGGTDDPVLVVQDHQAVHLSAGADAPDLGSVKALQKLGDPLQDRLFPVVRVLF